MKFFKNPFNLLSIAFFTRNLAFFFPVVILLYQNKGVSVGDYFLLQGIYLWAIFFMEIPSGYFGDLFSRKLNLAFSAMLSAVACLVWFVGYGFWTMLVVELLFGFSDAFSSGAGDAYIYDLCHKYKKTTKFHLILSKITFWEKNGLAFSACTGSVFMYFLGANGVIWVSLLAYLSAGIFYLFLPEVAENKRCVKNKSHFKDIWDICLRTLKNSELRLIIIVFSIISCNFAVFNWGLQPLMMENDFPVLMYSVVTGAAFVAWPFWAAVSGRLLEKINFRGVMWVSTGLYAAAYLLVILVGVLKGYSVIYFLLPVAAFLSGNLDLGTVSSSVLINYRTASDERATVLSVRGFISSFIRGLLLIMIKPLSEYVGMEHIFWIMVGLLVPSIISCFIISQRNLQVK